MLVCAYTSQVLTVYGETSGPLLVSLLMDQAALLTENCPLKNRTRGHSVSSYRSLYKGRILSFPKLQLGIPLKSRVGNKKLGRKPDGRT